MVENREAFAPGGAVAILFHPAIVPVVDVFRWLDGSDEPFDAEILCEPERDLSRHVDPAMARQVVSDAALLAFSLGTERSMPLDCLPPNSRQGSLEEYCIVSLVGAAHDPASDLAFEAAAALGVATLDLTLGLATDLLFKIEAAGLPLKAPSVAEFRAIVGGGSLWTEAVRDGQFPSYFTF